MRFRDLVAMGVALAIAALAPVAHAQGTGGTPGSEVNPPTGQKRMPTGRAQIELSFAPLVKETAPAVVNVYASKQVEASQSPFMGDPFFERFFGLQQVPPRARSSLGSGVLVDPKGIVVTNYHVIRDADEIKVATSDGREFESKVLLKDEEVDLAVLKIEASTPFPALKLGDSDALEVGDLVLAIGNPFGVGQTTTSGIVSALARSHIGVSDFGFFIQTDAAINPGNSGGALINMSGQLIGINTAIFSRSGGSIGIGFAIPSNMVRAVMQAAFSGADKFERPYIGASFEPVTAQIAEALGMDRPSGALVAKVEQGGPAEGAGLKPGDVILAVNDAPIEHVDALGYRLATQMIGANVKLTILRQGQRQDVSVVLVKTPEGAGDDSVTITGGSPFAGATVASLTPQLAAKMRIPRDVEGVAVVDLDRNSAAARIGIRPGDIVREVNGTEIGEPTDLAQAASESTRWWRFTIERGGRTLRQTMRF
ncbi:MAG: DegQ family serine endoprotease [Rhizobiaceae bacterium]|nr:DegQ family serine endoprotease [Rhizobiaceae bacterium]